jgi:hydroxyacylglutathione hydrolase
MKKIYKRTLSGLLISMLLIILFFTGYFIAARSITKHMNPAETGQIGMNVFSIKDAFVNMFLVKDGEQYIAFDAGNKPGNIEIELKKLNIEPDKIVAVLLTHSDGDHVAAISLFKNADIYLSKQEEKLTNGEKSRFIIFGNKIATDKYKLIEDQQVINIGNTKIQGLLCPGHTPGSMCYLVNDTLLFTGDALSLHEGKVGKFDRLFNMDSETAAKSIGKIIRTPGVKSIYTAHYGYTDDFGNAVKDWK